MPISDIYKQGFRFSSIPSWLGISVLNPGCSTFCVFR